MKLRQLEAFRAVVRNGTTAAAAHELGVSQPNVSNLVRHMEDQIGFELFSRRSGRLVPTAEAERIYQDIEPVFSMLKGVEQRIKDLRDSSAGSLRIVATPSMASSIVGHSLKRFLDKWPRIKVTLDIRRMENLIEQIQTRQAEIGVALSFEEHPSIHTEAIHEGTFVAVLAKTHPLASEPVITPRLLQGHRVISLERGTPLGSKIARAFKASQEHYDWSLETRYGYTACSMAGMGIGVALVDEYIARATEFAHLECRPFKPAVPVVAYMVYSRETPLSRIAQNYSRIVRDVIAERAVTFGAST
ncbi:MAG: LysR family transcriptional regulator [Nitratireductor sp.]